MFFWEEARGGRFNWIKYANADGTALNREERKKKAKLLYDNRLWQWKQAGAKEKYEHFPRNKKFAEFARKYVNDQKLYKNCLLKDDLRRGVLSGSVTLY